ncbi:MAG: hypothetical protein ACPGO5_01000 [Patescibacteria group bacterium]
MRVGFILLSIFVFASGFGVGRLTFTESQKPETIENKPVSLQTITLAIDTQHGTLQIYKDIFFINGETLGEILIRLESEGMLDVVMDDDLQIQGYASSVERDWHVYVNALRNQKQLEYKPQSGDIVEFQYEVIPEWAQNELKDT